MSPGDITVPITMSDRDRTVTVRPDMDPETAIRRVWRPFAHLGPEAPAALRGMYETINEFGALQEDRPDDQSPDEPLQELLDALDPWFAALDVRVPEEGDAEARLGAVMEVIFRDAAGGFGTLEEVVENEDALLERLASLEPSDLSTDMYSEVLELHPREIRPLERRDVFDPEESWLPGRHPTGPEHVTRYTGRFVDGGLEVETESEIAGRSSTIVPLPEGTLDAMHFLGLLPFLPLSDGAARDLLLVDLQPHLRLEARSGEDPGVEVVLNTQQGRIRLTEPVIDEIEVGPDVRVPALRMDATVTGEADPFLGLMQRSADDTIRVTLWVRAEAPHALLLIRGPDGETVHGHLAGDPAQEPSAWDRWLDSAGWPW